MGTRESLRYRRPAKSTPPLSDVVGRLGAAGPIIRVLTKSGDTIEVAPEDVVAVRPLTETPVRMSQIRHLEHAAARAWPGLEQTWIDGWFLRFSGGSSHRVNSAVPLEPWASWTALPAIEAWYAARGGTPWLAVPDRIVRMPAHPPAAVTSVVLTRELEPAPAPDVELAPRPDAHWLSGYARDVDVDVLTAVRDGDVVCASRPGRAVGRGSVTSSPDGTRWAGLAAVRVAPSARRAGHATALCQALLGWAADRGATRAYVQVLADNPPAARLYEAMGFHTQHRVRYVDARSL